MGTTVRFNLFFSILSSLLFFLLLLMGLKSLSVGQWYQDEAYASSLVLQVISCHHGDYWCLWQDLIRDVLGLNYSRLYSEEISAVTLMRFLKQSLPVFLLSSGFWLMLSGLFFLLLHRSRFWAQRVWPAIRIVASLPVFILAPLVLYFFFPSMSHAAYFTRVTVLSLLLSFRVVALTVETMWSQAQALMCTDHSRTMLSLGFSRDQVVFFWLRPLYLYPIWQKLPGLFIQWLAGSLLGEVFFNIQGLSWLLVQSLQGRDWSLVSHIVFCMLVIVGLLRGVVALWPAPNQHPARE
jgi:ABC-type dipeptide/oligopeptide/nickel transport system permease component